MDQQLACMVTEDLQHFHQLALAPSGHPPALIFDGISPARVYGLVALAVLKAIDAYPNLDPSAVAGESL